ncbi:MAG: EAL domain-containing protein [Thermoanaerobaculia bacterium]
MSGSLLSSVLDSRAITTVFQPAFEMNETPDGPPAVHFLECLSRGPKGTNIESAGVLFEYARRKGVEPALDAICLEGAFRSISESGYRPTISVNVHATTLEREPDFPRLLAGLADRFGIRLSGVILEIVEHGPDRSGPRLGHVLEALRGLGVRIALDDIGLGQSNYRRVLDCRPDYLKLDRYLVQGCHADPARRAVLESLTLLARRIGARVVAEGVETPEDLAEICGQGIGLLQGFLLARPTPLNGLGTLIEPTRCESQGGPGRSAPAPNAQLERSTAMAETLFVNVYCPDPDCDFRGSADAERYLTVEASRRCPVCGATPVRVEIPGRPSPKNAPRRWPTAVKRLDLSELRNSA